MPESGESDYEQNINTIENISAEKQTPLSSQEKGESEQILRKVTNIAKSSLLFLTMASTIATACSPKELITPIDEQDNTYPVSVETIPSELEKPSDKEDILKLPTILEINFEETVLGEEPCSLGQETIKEIVEEKRRVEKEIEEHNPDDIAESLEILIESSPDIQSILLFKDAMDNYKQQDARGILPAEYLRNTEWYKERVEVLGVEEVEKAMNFTYFLKHNQPIQCVTFIKIAQQLYPNLNLPDLSGTIYAAKDLAIHTQPPRNTLTYYDEPTYKATLIAGLTSINDYSAGDITVSRRGESGHVSLVLGKYRGEDGEVKILLVDSNRYEDGLLNIYYVDETNMEELLERQPRYILRRADKD